MDEIQEWIGIVGYLLPKVGVDARVDEMQRRTTWEVSERVDLGGTMCLQQFSRPYTAARDDAPSTQPDQMLISVAPERHTDHLSDYASLGWIPVRDTAYEDGMYVVVWESQRLRHITEVLEAAAHRAPPYVPPAYVPPQSYVGAGYANSVPSWEPTVQSGMRAGAMAAFLDGLTGGGFFDF